MATTYTPGTCTWDSDIEEYVLVDAFGNAFFGAPTTDCHTASAEASRVRIRHAELNRNERQERQDAADLYAWASGR